MKWITAFIMFLVPIFCVVGIYRYNAGLMSGTPVDFLPNWDTLLFKLNRIPETSYQELQAAIQSLRDVAGQLDNLVNTQIQVYDVPSFFNAIAKGFEIVGTFFRLIGELINTLVAIFLLPIRFVGFAIDFIFTT